MTHNGAHASGGVVPVIAWPEENTREQHRRGALENVQHGHQPGIAQSKRAQHIGCAGSAAAIVAYIDALPAANQYPRRKRAEEIPNQEREQTPEQSHGDSPPADAGSMAHKRGRDVKSAEGFSRSMYARGRQ